MSIVPNDYDKGINDAYKRSENKKPPLFVWDDEKVAEVAKIIYLERENSKIWTGDNTAELNIIRKYKFDTVIQEKISDLGIINVGIDNMAMVDIKKLENLTQYLSNYQAELQSL